jgi:hypothetical protein
MHKSQCLWALAVALVPLAQARAELVRDWRNTAHYPARVMAIHWESGRLDARTSVRFGAWTVRFGPPPQFALDIHFPAPYGRSLTIGGDNPDVNGNAAPSRKMFHCSNAAVGSRFCSFALYPKCQLLIYGSKIYIPDSRIDIPCPTALELAQ